jgi:glycosyltransferase involved in cell wall biosynthesis
MGLVDGEQALIADDPVSFAREVVRLYRDADLWGRLSAGGRAHIEARYGPETVERTLSDILDRSRRGELRRPSAA